MGNRKCPLCGAKQVLRVKNAEVVYPRCHWETPDGALLTCAFCHGARVDGEWVRTDSITQRAWELRGATSRKKDIEHYKDKLTTS